MAFLQWVRKILFFILVVGSLIIGLSFVAYGADWKEAPVFSFVFYLVIGLVPFLLGYLIRMGKKVKEFFWRAVRIYTAITIGFPLAWFIISFLDHAKRGSDAHPNDIYFQYGSITTILMMFSFIAIVVAYVFSVRIYVNWFKTPSKFYVILAVSLAIAVLPSLINTGYSAIREEGIVISKLTKENEIAWSEVDSVYLSGYKATGRGNSGFKWTFYFILENGDGIDFGPFGYGNYGLETSHDIKNKMIAENIPITRQPLTEEELEYIERDLENKEGNPDDFYSLFRYDPEIKGHY